MLDGQIVILKNQIRVNRAMSKKYDVPYLRLIDKREELIENNHDKKGPKESMIERFRNFLYWKDLKISTILIGLSAFSFLVLFISFVILTAFLS